MSNVSHIYQKMDEAIQSIIVTSNGGGALTSYISAEMKFRSMPYKQTLNRLGRLQRLGLIEGRFDTVTKPPQKRWYSIQPKAVPKESAADTDDIRLDVPKSEAPASAPAPAEVSKKTRIGKVSEIILNALGRWGPTTANDLASRLSAEDSCWDAAKVQNALYRLHKAKQVEKRGHRVWAVDSRVLKCEEPTFVIDSGLPDSKPVITDGRICCEIKKYNRKNGADISALVRQWASAVEGVLTSTASDTGLTVQDMARLHMTAASMQSFIREMQDKDNK